MPSRTYWMPALVLWFAAMGWLFSTKILPTFTNGQPPGYYDLLPSQEVVNPEPVRWLIRWNQKEIGWAENRISRKLDGTGRIVSEVNFEQLPVERMLSDLMGILGRFAKPMVEGIGPIDLRVSTQLDFDHYGTLSKVVSNVDVGELEKLLQVEGVMKGDVLEIKASVQTGDETTEIRKREIPIPADAQLSDSFSPRPKLANLRVGQTWTFQSYQPLLPHNPVSLIQATVEREELLEWNGTMVRTRMVTFSRDAGSGISSTRTPLSAMWVKKDGTVLRQDMMMASVKVQFIREGVGANNQKADARPVQKNDLDREQNAEDTATTEELSRS